MSGISKKVSGISEKVSGISEKVSGISEKLSGILRILSGFLRISSGFQKFVSGFQKICVQNSENFVQDFFRIKRTLCCDSELIPMNPPTRQSWVWRALETDFKGISYFLRKEDFHGVCRRLRRSPSILSRGAAYTIALNWRN